MKKWFAPIGAALILAVAATGQEIKLPHIAIPETQYIRPEVEKAKLFQQGYQVQIPLRGWIDTPTSYAFANSIGINWTNVPTKHIDHVMRHLDRNGITHIRVEIGWANLDHSGRITNENVLATLRAAKKYGVRVLVLFNVHEGAVPSQQVTVTLARDFNPGDRAIYVSHEDAKKLTLFQSGFSHAKTKPDEGVAPYRSGNVLLISSWDYGGAEWMPTVFSLSQPYYPAAPIGAGSQVTLDTMIAPPLFTARRNQDLTNATLMPVQLAHLHAWIGRYVKPVSQQVDAIMGKGKWDAEITNEQMFGASYQSASDQYIDDTARQQLGWTFGFILLDEIVRRSTQYIHSNHPGTAVVNGVTSQNIWRTSGTEINTEFLSRHFYVPVSRVGGNVFWHPEQTGNATVDGTNSMMLDIMPWTHNQFGRSNPSWNPDGSFGPSPTLAQTEGGSVPEYAAHITGKPISYEDAIHLRAKWEIRAFFYYANKAGQNRDGRNSRYYMYTLFEGNQEEGEGERHAVRHHQVALPSLFRHLEKTNQYTEGTLEASLTAPTFKAIKRARSLLPMYTTVTAPIGAGLQSVTSTHDSVQMTGESGILYNRDVVAVLPFQVDNDSLSIGLYVHTLNMAKVYAESDKPSRFDMPEEEYTITFTGFKTTPETKAKVVDMMTGSSRTVRPNTNGSFTLKLTDSVRVLRLDGVLPE